MIYVLLCCKLASSKGNCKVSSLTYASWKLGSYSILDFKYYWSHFDNFECKIVIKCVFNSYLHLRIDTFIRCKVLRFHTKVPSCAGVFVYTILNS